MASAEEEVVVVDVENPKEELVKQRPSVAFADNHQEIPHHEHDVDDDDDDDDDDDFSSSDDDEKHIGRRSGDHIGLLSSSEDPMSGSRHLDSAGFVSSDDAMSGGALVDEDDNYQADLEEQGALPQRLSHSERSGSSFTLLHRNSTSKSSKPTHHRRTSSSRDLETGMEGGARAQTAIVRTSAAGLLFFCSSLFACCLKGF